jgi:hypothetical protein
MAKLSSINKNERRKKLVLKYASKYEKLKAIADDEARELLRLFNFPFPRDEEQKQAA